MLPPARPRICLVASTDRYQYPRRLTSTTLVNKARSVSSMARQGLITALLTRMSRPPWVRCRCSPMAAMSSIFPIWQARPSALRPCSRNEDATRSHSSGLRLLMTTCAPASASTRAVTSPMPIVDPVISATLPVRSKGVDRVGRRAIAGVSVGVMAMWPPPARPAGSRPPGGWRSPGRPGPHAAP